MSEKREPRTFDFASDPEVVKVFTDVMHVLMTESDRGAVLVGLSVVDQHLRKLFEHGLPSDMATSNAKKRLLDYPGPLSGVAAKADVARATNRIGADVHQAINRLRQLRNVVAHEPDAFRLDQHRDVIHAMSQLGDSMPEFIEMSAQITISNDVVERLKNMTISMPDEEPKHPFKTAQEIMEHAQSRPDLMETLKEKVLRMQFGLAVGYICGLMAAYREMPFGPHRTSSKGS